jgi:hypothetical protein
MRFEEHGNGKVRRRQAYGKESFANEVYFWYIRPVDSYSLIKAMTRFKNVIGPPWRVVLQQGQTTPLSGTYTLKRGSTQVLKERLGTWG